MAATRGGGGRAFAGLGLLFGCILVSGAFAAEPDGGKAGFRLVQEGGVWWFQDPSGNKFLSKGVDCMGPGTAAKDYDRAKPEYSVFVHLGDTYESWEKRTLSRLRSWGFNTIGAWSDGRLYRSGTYSTPILHYQLYINSIWHDLWAADYEKRAEAAAKDLLKPYLDNPDVVGCFVDNEFGWGEDYFLGLYLSYPEWMGDKDAMPGKKHAIGFMRGLYRDDFRLFLKDFSTTAGGWDGLFTATTTARRAGRGHRAIDAWMEEVGKRYYGVAAKSLKAADPRHLLMGDRFRQFYPQGVARAARGYMDVISTNYEAQTTDGWISPVYFETMHELSGCPVIIGEVYATARQNRSGNRNHGGEFTLVDTQAQRGAVAAAQIRNYAAFPFVVGWHWFQWSDEPTYGRGDGEDFNMGLVDIYDAPYDEFTAAVGAANREAEAIHSGSAAKAPVVLPLAARRQAGLVADGKLGDWDKSLPVPRALVKAREPVAPFADVFLAWDESALWIAVRAYDFSYPHEYPVSASDPATWGELNRLKVKVGGVEVNCASGLVKEEGNTAGKTVRFAVPPKKGHLSAAIWSTIDSWHYVWEVAIPASELGVGALKAGKKLDLVVGIQNRGDYEVMRLGDSRGVEVILAR